MVLAVGLAAAASVASPPLGAQEAARGFVTIDGPLLSYRAQPPARVTIDGPLLSYRAQPPARVTIDGPLLSYRAQPPARITIDGPLLSYRARPPARITIDGPLLSYRAQPSVAAPTGSLELVELPLEPRASTYLRVDSATVDIAKGLTLRYGGLPATRGYGALFFMDEPKPRLAAWFYTAANRPDGEYTRASLPPFTGNWKACIGFPPGVTTNNANPDLYDDCLDFVAAGPGSIGAEPSIVLPAEGILAGRDALVSYDGMPACNCRIEVRDAQQLLVASHMTSYKASGTWRMRLATPGTHELRLYFHGAAIRARMTLEVKP